MRKAILFFSLALMMSSCATMFGGSRYVAQVQTTNPESDIYINGDLYGSGNVEILQSRNKPLTVEARNPISGNSTRKVYENEPRIGTGILSFLSWGLIGPVVDFATGAIFRPDTDKKGVTRMSAKKYQFVIDSPEQP